MGDTQNCKIVEEKEKNYPECCPKVVGCKKNNFLKGKKKKGKRKVKGKVSWLCISSQTEYWNET